RIAAKTKAATAASTTKRNFDGVLVAPAMGRRAGTATGCGGGDGACRAAEISATVHLRSGSGRRQFREISRKGGGSAAGMTGPLLTSALRKGKRWVRASITITPSDQMSGAGDMIRTPVSGAL